MAEEYQRLSESSLKLLLLLKQNTLEESGFLIYSIIRKLNRGIGFISAGQCEL